MLRLIVIHNMHDREFRGLGLSQLAGSTQRPLGTCGKIRCCQDLHTIAPNEDGRGPSSRVDTSLSYQLVRPILKATLRRTTRRVIGKPPWHLAADCLAPVYSATRLLISPVLAVRRWTRPKYSAPGTCMFGATSLGKN